MAVHSDCTSNTFVALSISDNGSAVLALSTLTPSHPQRTGWGYAALPVHLHVRGRFLEVPGDPYLKLASQHNSSHKVFTKTARFQ